MTRAIPIIPAEFDRSRILERPDGFWWQAKHGGREYGPFATLVEAVADMQSGDDGAPEPAAQPGLKAVSRAQLGPDAERRPYRPREEDASVEDPLQDWPKEE